MKDAHQTKGSQSKGQNHSHHCHREGLSAHGNQFLEFALQAGEKQQ